MDGTKNEEGALRRKSSSAKQAAAAAAVENGETDGECFNELLWKTSP